jgi:hypothetical protein
MIRWLPLLGFGGVFLMISPKLRDVWMGCVATGVEGIVKYSPWSYIGAVVGLVLFAMMSNYRSSNPR